MGLSPPIPPPPPLQGRAAVPSTQRYLTRSQPSHAEETRPASCESDGGNSVSWLDDGRGIMRCSKPSRKYSEATAQGTSTDDLHNRHQQAQENQKRKDGGSMGALLKWASINSGPNPAPPCCGSFIPKEKHVASLPDR